MTPLGSDREEEMTLSIQVADQSVELVLVFGRVHDFTSRLKITNILQRKPLPCQSFAHLSNPSFITVMIIKTCGFKKTTIKCSQIFTPYPFFLDTGCFGTHFQRNAFCLLRHLTTTCESFKHEKGTGIKV